MSNNPNKIDFSDVDVSGALTEFRVNEAIRNILADYGDTVSVEQKNKKLVKFGQNNGLGTTQQLVWLYAASQGIESLPTSGNPIDTISSSNAGDNQAVIVEGHTLSGSELTFVAQSATLNGQAKVTLGTPLFRATRLYNNGSTNFAGTVYCYQDQVLSGGAPTVPSQVHVTANTGNQSLKAATSISNLDYWIVTNFIASVDRQASRSVDFAFQIREFGKVFRTQVPLSINSGVGTVQIDFDPCIIVPKNADMRVLATSSGTGTGVRAVVSGYLAGIVS